MSLSNYAENEILDHLMGIGSFTMPTVYIALCTADPTDAGTGASMNEVADSGSYARLALAADFGTPAASGSVSNDGEILFVEATGSWGTVTHFAILDSGTHGAGNMLCYGELTQSRTISSGDVPRFGIGDLTISLD